MNQHFNYRNWTLLLTRLALAAVVFPHGAQKALGWFGGYGLAGTYEAFTVKLHIPGPLAALAIIAEFLGALGIAFGLLTRLSAIGVAATMTVAAIMNLRNGFFMNWFGTQKGEGIEYFVPVIAICVLLLIEGAGQFSLDGLISRLRTSRRSLTTA